MTAPVGAALPSLDVAITRTFVVAGAVATRDFTEVHHDPDAARAQGARDVFLNILTTNGLVARFVTDWAGPDAVLKRISLRLGVPAYPGDTLRFTGHVAAVDDGVTTVEVRGATPRGDHVTARVRVERIGSSR